MSEESTKYSHSIYLTDKIRSSPEAGATIFSNSKSDGLIGGHGFQGVLLDTHFNYTGPTCGFSFNQIDLFGAGLVLYRSLSMGPLGYFSTYGLTDLYELSSRLWYTEKV